MSIVKSRERLRSGRALATLIATVLVIVGLVVQVPAAAGAGDGSGNATPAQGVLPFPGDVYTIGSNGSLIAVDPSQTPASAPLFNLAGEPLNLTWGQFSSATASSEAKQNGNHTGFDIALDGLIPNGVYSLFYRTFSPDSNNPFCPNVEPMVALTARQAQQQQPDADSFVADSSGHANFDARVAGRLMDAQQVQIAVIYHFDGKTYGPVANFGESQGPVASNGGLCRSSYGIDAMRQLLIIQK